MATSRRIYTLALFGVSAIVAFVSLLVVAFIAFEDLFDGAIGRDTFLDARVPIALTVTTGLLTWYHFGVYRRDRTFVDAAQPAGPKRMTIVGRIDDDLVRELRDRLDGAVRHWERTDEADRWTGDIEVLAEALLESENEDVLVMLQGAGFEVVPYRLG